MPFAIASRVRTCVEYAPLIMFRYGYARGQGPVKITKAMVRQFESDQRGHGTEIAMSNLIWLLASHILNDLGIRKVLTVYKRKRVD